MMSGWFRWTVLLLQSMRLARADDEEGAAGGRAARLLLPRSSAEFYERFSCDGLPHGASDAGDGEGGDDDDPFLSRVLAARHTTWRPGWEVALPRSSSSSSDADAAAGGGDGAQRYARVFDLLNWARERGLAPEPVNVSSICHKGMEGRPADDGPAADVPPPAPPNGYVPGEAWSDLWGACRDQLVATTRLAASCCIDVPGVLVANPRPPMRANNPCRREHRMVDGAHRICLRKYLLALLAGELAELEELAKGKGGKSSMDDVLHTRIRQKRSLIDRTSHGLYFVMNQTTFQSMLTSADPHASWAKDRETLTKDVTEELRRDWKKWMRGAMDRVGESKKENHGEECGEI